MNSPTACRLVLVRHGEIHGNVSRVWHGSTDDALTEAGRDQALRVGDHLGRTERSAAALYCSPLTRTRDTAAPIGAALGLRPVGVPGLVEWSIGEWEGTPYLDLARRFDFFREIERDATWTPPGGESRADVTRRFVTALREIGAHHPGERVIVVAHGAAMALAVSSLVGNDPSTWQTYGFKNASVSELALGETAALVRFNEVSHLA